MSDPILETIADADPALHEALLSAVIDLGKTSAESVAQYGRLTPRAIERLMGLPAAGSDVRRTLAANPAIDAATLLQLATDTDEWVRWWAYRNPKATDEHRAAVALVSSPEQLAPRDLPEREDPATEPERLRELSNKYCQDEGQYQYQFRADIAANPSLPDDCIPSLVGAAIHRWEWRALWNRHGAVWPSTQAFMDPHTPDWVRSALSSYGHPAGLLSNETWKSEYPIPVIEGVVQLINSELLIRALWRELALEGVVELIYWNDSGDGDKFSPHSPAVSLMDGGAAEHIVGGFNSDREWIDTEDYLTGEGLIRHLADTFEDCHYGTEEFTEETLNQFTMSGVAFAVFNEVEGQSIIITETGQAMVDDVVDVGNIDPDNMDTKVIVTESRLPHVVYGATTTAQKLNLVSLLQGSRVDPMLQHWGISDHFLMCIALHPMTPEDVRHVLLNDEAPDVRQAAGIAIRDAQPSVPSEPSAAETFVKTLTIAPWLGKRH